MATPARRLVSLLFLLLVGCGRDSAYLLAPQIWNETEFMVEIRPGKPRVGMNEFVVISTKTDGKPAYNYIISIRSSSVDAASQMIQDGHTGVYRRAIEVKDPDTDTLIMQIAEKSEIEVKTELRFPLSKHI